VLARHFPCLSCPHPGYTSRQAKPHVIEGQRYARTINSSFFVPACGTVANEIIRKHFEVPGSRACLITESSAAIQAAGFVDMKNCVIADENDVVDKVAYLLANPEELEAITQAGYDLVHSRHTIRQRDQLLQWFRLHQQLKDGERIIQPSPFEALRKVATSSGITSTHVHSGGLLITTIGEGDENLRQAKYEVAERQFLTCVNYYRFMPEPQVKLAISLLYRGKAEEALSWIHKPIRFTLLDYKALDPDPVEWALLIRTLLCSGRVREASERAAQFPWMRHPELDRVRSLVSFLNRGEGALKTEPGSGHFRQSIHELPWGDSSDWTEELIKMLRACGQGRLAERLASAPVQVPPIAEAIAIMDQPEDSAPPVRFQADGFAWARFSSQAAEKFRETAKVLLRLLENRFGYFLPFALSQVRYDEFFALVRDLARDERMKKILVIGASRRKRTTQAVLTGVKENPNKPLLLCVSTDESDRRGRLKPAWYSIGSSSRGTRAEALSRTIEQIRREWSVDGFDVVVIDSTEADLSDHQDLRHISEAAQVLCLEGIDRPQAHRTCATFLDNADYWLLEYNPGLRNGYAVFEKQQHSESLDALEPLPAHSHDAAAERKYSVVASK